VNRAIAAGSSSLVTVANGASRRAIGNERAAFWRADDGQCGRCGVGAAFGAARNVDGEIGKPCDAGCQRARSDMRRCANRRAGAGNNGPSWIVGAHDETKPFGVNDKGGCGVWRKPDRDERAARCGAKSVRSRRTGGFDQAFERARIDMAEGKPDAAGQQSVAQRMQADRFTVVAGLVPAIHVFELAPNVRRGCPARGRA
jgi:hypothetical protein